MTGFFSRGPAGSARGRGGGARGRQPPPGPPEGARPLLRAAAASSEEERICFGTGGKAEVLGWFFDPWGGKCRANAKVGCCCVRLQAAGKGWSLGGSPLGISMTRLDAYLGNLLQGTCFGWGDGPHDLCIFDEIRGRSFRLFGLQTSIPVFSTHHAFQEKVNADINRRIPAAGAPAKNLLIFGAHRQLMRRAAHPSPEQSEVNLHLFCVAPPGPLLPHHTRATLRVSGLLPGQAIL